MDHPLPLRPRRAHPSRYFAPVLGCLIGLAGCGDTMPGASAPEVPPRHELATLRLRQLDLQRQIAAVESEAAPILRRRDAAVARVVLVRAAAEARKTTRDRGIATVESMRTMGRHAVKEAEDGFFASAIVFLRGEGSTPWGFDVGAATPQERIVEVARLQRIALKSGLPVEKVMGLVLDDLRAEIEAEPVEAAVTEAAAAVREAAEILARAAPLHEHLRATEDAIARLGERP